MESPKSARTRNKLSDALKTDKIFRQKSFEAKEKKAKADFLQNHKECVKIVTGGKVHEPAVSSAFVHTVVSMSTPSPPGAAAVVE